MRQIVAWVNKTEQKRIEKLNQQYGLNFCFVNNFEDFVIGIRSDTISLILRRKANIYLKKTFTIIINISKTYFLCLCS